MISGNIGGVAERANSEQNLTQSVQNKTGSHMIQPQWTKTRKVTGNLSLRNSGRHVGTEAVLGRHLQQEAAGGTWFEHLDPGTGETGQNQG